MATTTKRNGLGYQIRKFRPLVKELIKRDLKVKYRRSFLGYLWSLLNPLLMMTVMSIVFSRVFRWGADENVSYPLYLICGQTLFNFFTESTNQSMFSILQNSTLLKKVFIPKFIFPVARTLSSFVTMSFSLLAIVIVFPFTGTKLTPCVLLFFVPLIFLFLFSCGVGLILSSLSVYFRDVTHLYGVVTLAWMYGTPIFYPQSIIENFSNPYVKVLFKLNPLYHFISFFRCAVIYGTVPTWETWVGCIVSGVAVFLIGMLVFHKLQKNFILYI